MPISTSLSNHLCNPITYALTQRIVLSYYDIDIKRIILFESQSSLSMTWYQCGVETRSLYIFLMIRWLFESANAGIFIENDGQYTV